MISPFLSPFGAIAQGAAGGYQSALSRAMQARQFAAQMALKNAMLQGTMAYHQGMVQNGANRATAYDQSVQNNGAYQQGRLAETQAKNVGLGIIPPAGLPASPVGPAVGATSFSTYGQAPAAPPDPNAGLGPTTVAKIAQARAQSGLTGARADYVAGPQTAHTQAQAGYIAGPQTAHTQAGTALLTTQNQQLPLNDHQRRMLEQAQASQDLMNAATLPGLRKAQGQALSTNAGANAYRAQVFGADDPIRAQAAAAQAAAAGQNAGTNAGGLQLRTDVYNNGTYGQRNSAAGGGKLPNGMTYQQAAAAKQANLSRITYLSNVISNKTIDPQLKANAINEINSRSLQNQELDRALPAGNGLAPMPVGVVTNGSGRPMPGVKVPSVPALPNFGGMTVYTSRSGQPTALGPAPVHHSASQLRHPLTGQFQPGLSKVPTKELLRRLMNKVK